MEEFEKAGEIAYRRGRYELKRRNNGGTFYICWREHGKPKRLSTRTTQVEDAILALDNRYRQDDDKPSFCIACGRPMADALVYRLDDAIADYRSEVGDKRTSRVSIRSRLNHFLDFMEVTDQNDLTCADVVDDTIIEEFREWSSMEPVVWRNGKGEITKSKSRTPATTEDTVNQIQAVLNHAVKKERSDVSPTFKTKTRAEVSRPIKIRCDESVMADMLAYAKETEERRQLHSFLVASICTLARPDAVLDISVDPERGQWAPKGSFLDLNPEGRIQTKKRRPIVPIMPPLAALLNETYEYRDVYGDFVVNYRGQQMMRIDTSWERMLATLGLPNERGWKPYLIRRSVSTLIRDVTEKDKSLAVNYWDLQGMMGHRVAGTTELYTKSQLYPSVQTALELILADIDGYQSKCLINNRCHGDAKLKSV